MDPFTLLTTAAAGIGLSPSATALFAGTVAVSIGLAIVSLMKGEPKKAIKLAIIGSVFLGVVWKFGQVTAALRII
jgi:hypothetical protein